MRADNVVNYGGITLINGMGLCLPRRDAVGAQCDRVRSIFGDRRHDGGRCGLTALSLRMLFFSVIGAFSGDVSRTGEDADLPE